MNMNEKLFWDETIDAEGTHMDQIQVDQRLVNRYRYVTTSKKLFLGVTV